MKLIDSLVTTEHPIRLSFWLEEIQCVEYVVIFYCSPISLDISLTLTVQQTVALQPWFKSTDS